MAHARLRGVVALDGPSGTGKSTVSRKLAAALGATYLDTGAMYRAVTLAVLRAQVEPSDEVEVVRVVRAAELTMGTDPERPGVLLDGQDVGQEIRGPEVTRAVSAVSAVAEVRDQLVALQRELIGRALREPGGIVVEGRDIGTVVVPDAGLKVYLTASSTARAERRTAQDVSEGRAGDLDRTHADVQRRDALDSGRKVAPLRKADDALELDTTDLDVAGVLEQLHKHVESRGLLTDGSPGA
ncbi:cytidylate kinase [Saccharopolyspora antimicrobica]|uniref:Cytidylate kinase n=1 Tax=Saccharopolyspora antimicrobica TaxID=455193 RepID=A0A1I5H4D3_9PSEU|nr:(d)CMP kinase [Saccharopolyspora antimicrobica]RKT90135.1 cytidylate kinase [Saccharopolyspora antimicrobica]SFO43124.1 cytidylate kinase [Saccharopolyspora antimicrobica]